MGYFTRRAAEAPDPRPQGTIAERSTGSGAT